MPCAKLILNLKKKRISFLKTAAVEFSKDYPFQQFDFSENLSHMTSFITIGQATPECDLKILSSEN